LQDGTGFLIMEYKAKTRLTFDQQIEINK